MKNAIVKSNISPVVKSNISPVVKSNISPVIKFAQRDDVKEKFHEIFDNATKTSSFMSALINVVNNNNALKKCDPSSVIGAGLVAASLDLSVNQGLGFAWLVPYKDKCQFQLGYKGYIQLAMRSGQYKKLVCTPIYEDELQEYDYILEEIIFTPKENHSQRSEDIDDKVIGYYASFELLNGFSKSIYMTKAQIEKHGKKYSKTYSSNSHTNIWKSNFDEMALKTVLKKLLSKFGILSIEMQEGIEKDQMIDNKYEDNPQNIIEDDDIVVVSEVDNMINDDTINPDVIVINENKESKNGVKTK